MIKFISYIIEFHPNTCILNKHLAHSITVDEDANRYLVTYPNTKSMNSKATYITAYSKHEFDKNYKSIGNLSWLGENRIDKFEGRICFEIENNQIHILNRVITKEQLMNLVNDMIQEVNDKIKSIITTKLNELYVKYETLKHSWNTSSTDDIDNLQYTLTNELNN